MTGRMVATKYLCYFLGLSIVLGFLVPTLLNYIILNTAYKKTDYCHQQFYTVNGATAFATLEEEHITSHIRIAIMDNITSAVFCWRGYPRVKSS